jgi:type IV secretory pathway component VirB8
LITEEKKKGSPKRKWFDDYFKDFTESEIQKEILFAQQLTIDKLEKVRSNTSKIVWWLIVIPIIIAVILAIF